MKEFAQNLKSTMQKRTRNLHERDNRAKKHCTQRLLYSRIAVFVSHCGELNESVEMTVR